MHLEKVYQEYHKEDVKVAFILSGITSDYTRQQEFPRFNEELKVSYMGLDDRGNEIIALYKLNPSSSVPKTLIIDREGIVRLVGETVSWTKMADAIEAAMGRTENPALSTAADAIASLKSERSYSRWKAAQALGEMGDKTAVDPLVEAMSDESAVVREMTVQALGKIGDKRAFEALKTALDDEVHAVRLETVKALGQVKDEQAIVPLVKALADADLLPDAANALGAIAKPELVDKALEDNSEVLKRSSSRNRGLVYSRLGLAYKQHKLYDAAILAYKKAIEVTPDSYYRTDYSTQLAECYMDAGKSAEAATAYLKAARSSDNNRHSVTMSYGNGKYEKFTEREWTVRRILDSAQQQNKIDVLANILAEKLSESSSDQVLYAMLVGIYDKQGKNEEAIPLYEKLLELDSGNSKNYIRLAMAYKRSGNSDKAAEMTRGMSDHVSGDSSIHSMMAEVYLECEMTDEAIEAYKKAMNIAQGDWEREGYQYALGNCYENTGKYAEAIAEYEKLAAGSSSWKSRVDDRLWEVYKKGELHDAAIEKYQKMVKSNPEDADAHRSLARAYQGNDEFEKAVAEYEEAIRLEPDNIRAMEDLGDLCKKHGDLEKAIACYREAADIAPVDYYSLYDRLGDLYVSAGMTDEAIAEYDRAMVRELSEIKQGSTDPITYERLARFYMKKKVKSAEAVSLAQKAVELAPKDVSYKNILAAAYLNNEQEEKAMQKWMETGFVIDSYWMVIGPFDNANKAGFSKVYPPEQSIALGTKCQGIDKEVAWQEARDSVPDAYIDLNEIFDEADWTVAYAFAQIISPDDREAQLRIGSDDGAKVWLNGEEVLSSGVGRSAGIDQDIIPVKLKGGVNKVLMKVCDEAVDWGFYVRITDMEGNPYTDLSYSPTDKLYSLAQ